jgi:hypothetical protein
MASTDVPQTDPKVLASIFRIDAKPAGLWKPDELRSIFRHQLDAALEGDLGAATSLSFAQLLRDERPPLSLLRSVKDFAKRSRNSESPLPEDVATALYFAAIAVALLRHNERITDLDDKGLARGFGWGVAQPWVDDDTKRLFAEAARKL